MINLREKITENLKELVKDYGDIDYIIKEDKVYTIQELLDEVLDEKSDMSNIVSFVSSRIL